MYSRPTPRVCCESSTSSFFRRRSAMPVLQMELMQEEHEVRDQKNK